MSKLKKYSVIEEKLELVPGPGVDALWSDMQAHLHRHLPEEKERRRMLWWWKNSGSFLVIPFAIFLCAILYTIVVLDRQQRVEQEPGVAAPVLTQGDRDVVAVPDKNENNRPAMSAKDGLPPATTADTAMHHMVPGNKTETTTTASRTYTNTIHDKSTVPIVLEKLPVRAAIQTGSQEKLIFFQEYQQGKIKHVVPEMTFNNASDLAESEAAPLRIAATDVSVTLEVPSVLLQQDQLRPPAPDSMDFLTDNKINEKLPFAKKFVAGTAVHLNLPVSDQEMSTVSLNGAKNTLIDYLPSVYLQYHFASRWFVQSEFQAIAPQHTPKLTLASTTAQLGVDRKQVHAVELTKLYYMNLPLSLHYRVLPNLYAGAGIQYAYLTRTLLMEEESTWQKGDSGWEQKTSTKKLYQKGNPKKEKEKNNRNNNPTDPMPAPPSPADVVAQQFRSNDWRFTSDLNYYHRRFNGGIRMNIGINNYIDTEVNAITMPVKDRNKSFQLYIRYNIWEQRKKKS